MATGQANADPFAGMGGGNPYAGMGGMGGMGAGGMPDPNMMAAMMNNPAVQ